ncbi:MAG: type II and III secretion system protein family protein [Phenylobacterium sp.]|uniref:type II and III secretion system protein family protein n=1 Tax=Phenylobacterium sp. TaxID=1871053 RepID=UPI00391D3FED
MIRKPLVAAGALAAALLACAGPAGADAFPTEAATSRTIHVPKDKSLSFRLDGPASRIVVAQPETAQIVATTDRSFYVRGKALGSTNLLVYGDNGVLHEVIDVEVGHDVQSIQADLAAALPGEMITVRNLGQGVILTGEVSNTSVAARAKSLAEKMAPEAVTSALTVRAAQQVLLEVRVLEAGRSALQDLGFNIAAANNSTFSFASGTGLLGNSDPQAALTVGGAVGTARLDVTLQVLEEKGILRTLARPNLVALSGEKASFLAGGEFPYPVPAGNNQVGIEFRPFGVKLGFQPLVEDNGLIRLQVSPEVSQIDGRTSLTIEGYDMPSLTVRRAETTVELRSGESFAIAGLFQQDYSNAVRKVPGAGDLPVLGMLFRSARWKRQETELVIIVTPRLASAAEVNALAPAPFANSREPSAASVMLGGQPLDRLLEPTVGGEPTT